MQTTVYPLYNIRKSIFRLVLLAAAILAAGRVWGRQLPDTSVVMHLKIAYPMNETRIYESYLSNPRMLKLVKEYLQKSPQIDSITIYSYASPEGPLYFNKYLAKERGIRAKEYLLKHLPPHKMISEDKIKIDPTYENWQGLYELVEQQYPYNDKNDVLALLKDGKISDEQRKARLKKINGGKPWRYIRSEILPHLRYATWIAVWQKIELENSLPAMPQYRHKPEDIAVKTAPRQVEFTAKPLEFVYVEDTVKVDTKTILALKSNLLYDAASLLNFSIEAPVYKEKLSFLYYHQAPWWTWGKGDNEYCIRFLSIGGEARWWFAPKTREATERRIKRDRFVGHFLGVYSESGKYDFEYKTDICRQGEFWSAGLSYGYAMPVGKRINLEFSLSVGYASIAFRGYAPSEDYGILWRDPDKVGRWKYIGPTKAQISLVIPITAKLEQGGQK